MIDLDALNSFSRRFAELLFAEHPEWLSYATVPAGEGWDEGVLVVSARSPVSLHTLSVDTDGGEVTVGFGETGWHAHFWAWDGLDEATVFARALEEIAAILSEDVAILTRIRGGEIGSSETFWRGEQIKFNGAERVEIISWLGSRDATAFPA